MESGEKPGESVTVMPFGDKSDTWQDASRFCQNQNAIENDPAALG